MSQDRAPDDREWLLLTRYLTGDLSPAEAAAVERWFEADPRHRALLDELREVWLVAGGETSGWNTDRAIAELRQRALGMTERRAAVGRDAVRRRPVPRFTVARTRSWVALAAGIGAALIGGGALGWHLLSDATPSVSAIGVHAPVTDVATRRAQRTEVLLPDGTRATLGPSSRLSYGRDFGRRDRAVFVEGEAYFDVVHNGAKPFRVWTAEGVTEDVGTAFVVRARAASLQVVVAEGAVVLRPAASRAAGDSLLLTAGQLGRVSPEGQLDRAHPAQPDAYWAWTKGELAFEDVPLAEVAEELTRWYDVEVQVADSLTAVRRFSGRFTQKTIDEVVRLVASVADVSVHRTERGWVFQGRRSS